MEWFKFRMQWQRPMMKLSDEDAGKVIKALLAYVATGEETETDTPGDILLCSLFEQLEGDLEAFREKAEQKEGIREKRRAAGRRSGEVRRAKAGRAQQGPSVDPVCPDESENDPVCSDVLPDEPVCPDMPPDVSQSDPVCSDLPGKVLESVPVRSDLFVPNKNTEPRNTEPRSKNTEPGISETETERETDTEGENTSFCSELLTEVSEQPLETIPLNDGTEYPVYRREADEYARLYPAVDVVQELRNIRGWCLANPARRKTKSGVRRFINTWLRRAQDKGGGREELPPENPFLVYARGEATAKGIFDWT